MCKHWIATWLLTLAVAIGAAACIGGAETDVAGVGGAGPGGPLGIEQSPTFAQNPADPRRFSATLSGGDLAPLIRLVSSVGAADGGMSTPGGSIIEDVNRGATDSLHPGGNGCPSFQMSLSPGYAGVCVVIAPALSDGTQNAGVWAQSTDPSIIVPNPGSVPNPLSGVAPMTAGWYGGVLTSTTAGFAFTLGPVDVDPTVNKSSPGTSDPANRRTPLPGTDLLPANDMRIRIGFQPELDWETAPGSNADPSVIEDCGPTGWLRRADGSTALRLAMMVRVQNLSLSASYYCLGQINATTNPIEAQVCQTVVIDTGLVPSPTTVGNLLTVATEDLDCDLSLNFAAGLGSAADNEIHVCLNADLVVQPCTYDFDASAASGGATPVCPEVTLDSLTPLPASYIRLPEATLRLDLNAAFPRRVDRVSGAVTQRLIATGGVNQGEVLNGGSCDVISALVNTAEQLPGQGIQQLNNNILSGFQTTLVAQLQSMMGMTNAVIPPTLFPTAPTVLDASGKVGISRPLIAPPTCALDMTSIVSGLDDDNGACLLQWLHYAIPRTALRYFSVAFNTGGTEPEGPIGPTGQPGLGISAPRFSLTDWRATRSVGETTAPSPIPSDDLDIGVCTRGPGGTSECAPLPSLASCPGVVHNSLAAIPLDLFQDADGDSIPDACDNCPYIPNRSQRDCNFQDEYNLGSPVLGDPCDPQQCAEFTAFPSTLVDPVATDPAGSLDFCTQTATGPLNSLAMVLRPTVGSSSPTMPIAVAAGGPVAGPPPPVPGPLQLRRCACADQNGAVASTIAACTQLALCLQNGTPGPVGTDSGWQMADVQHGNVACRLGLQPNGTSAPYAWCQPALAEPFVTDVTNLEPSLSAARLGEEVEPSDTWSWTFREESNRAQPPAVVPPTQGALIQNLIGLPSTDLPVYLWSRAGTVNGMVDTGTDPAAILADTYSPAIVLTNSAPGCPLPHGGMLEQIWHVVYSPMPPEGRWSELRGARFAGLIPVANGAPLPAPGLAGDFGDLDKSLSSLVVGVYEGIPGHWTALARSLGDVPPVTGTAFAFASGNDSRPHIFGIGGDLGGSPSPYLYDGSIEVDGADTVVQWTKTSLGGSTSTVLTLAPPPGSGVNGPGPRTHAAVAASPRGDALFMYGGLSPNGPMSDLWCYQTDTGIWSQITTGATLATAQDAGMTASRDSIAIFGGVDEKQAYVSSLTIVHPNSGVTWQLPTQLAGRANPALSIAGTHVYVFAGTTASGPTDSFASLSIIDGSTQSDIPTGFAASTGAIDQDALGTLAVLPAGIVAPGYAGQIFVGAPSAFATVIPSQGTGLTATCVGTAAVQFGAPCQPNASWAEIPGAIACGVSAPVCAGAIAATIGSWSLDGVGAFAAASNTLATASGQTVSLYNTTDIPAAVGSLTAPAAVTALVASAAMVFVASGNTISTASITDASSALTIAAQTCGDVIGLAQTGSVLLALTSTGLARFTIGPTGLTRLPPCGDADFDDLLPDAHGCRDARRGNCGAWGDRCTADTSLELTSDGTAWIRRGSTVIAYANASGAIQRVRDDARYGHSPIQIRALGSTLAVLAADGLSDTLAVVSQVHPDHDDHGAPDSDDVQYEVVHRGPNQLGAWVTDRPVVSGHWIMQLSGSQLQGANVTPP